MSLVSTYATPQRWLSRIGLTGAVLAAMATLSAPAPASPERPATNGCAPDASASNARVVGEGSEGHEHEDAAFVSAEQRAQITKKLTAVEQQRRASRATAADPMRVKVWIHIIRGSHSYDPFVTVNQAKFVYAALAKGFRGSQDPTMAASPFTFALERITVTKKDSWFHGGPGSGADIAMKKALHRGTADDLNIYIKAPQFDGGTLLGFARFPWQYKESPALDGVTIHASTLPGGKFRNYNLGDTVIHETGHWLGLFHTFEGGCVGNGDGVGDTPAEASPAEGCPVGRDSCLLIGGRDPIDNFMNYSFDACMDSFTVGQQDRMAAAFQTFRLGK